ncbi:MAG: hypothetical protein ACPGJS_13340 [Flammeovirgaceae bacterium]
MNDITIPETQVILNPALETMQRRVDELVNQLGAYPLQLPEGLATIRGSFKGQEVYMNSLAWQNDTFRLIRYTGLFCEDKIATFNFVLYPHHCFDAPIFASDWVILGKKLRIAVMDAMPLFPQEEKYARAWVEPFQPLHELSTQLADTYERKLSWSTKYLGEAACLATQVDVANLVPIVSLWNAYLQLYLALTQHLTPISAARKQEVVQWHQHYNQAHRAIEDQRNPYMVYFGEELGKRFNQEFLFSDDFGDIK